MSINLPHNKHPGQFLWEYCLLPNKITLTAFAKEIKTSRKNLSEIVNGKTSITIEMAFELSKHFCSITPKEWLIAQLNYDLWKYKRGK